MAAPRLRRTRIVCISDTHNCTVKLPKGDILIHAGDLTDQGSYSELSKAVRWLEAADFEAKIVVAGNHDITLDSEFYAEHGLRFHNQNPQSPADCLALLTFSPSITYLCHASASVRLASPTGPHTEFSVFGSPYSPGEGLWAFSYDVAQASLWDRIPLETDVVVTHTPPRTHCDTTDERQSAGCEALRRALWRVRPRLAVCGHVHNGRGSERVMWGLDDSEGAYAERHIVNWTDHDSNNNRLSLVDLTGKHAPPLDNDGSDPCRQSPAAPTAGASPSDSKTACQGGECSTTGLGGDPSRDGALAGRMGRRETCVVNAAIMKGNYPYVGGKQFHKPIVVDVDLPVWEE